MRYSLAFLLLFVCQIAHAHDWDWLKPKFINPDKFDKHTFKDGTKGFKVEFTVGRSDFDGKVPETLDVFVVGNFRPEHVHGLIDGERIAVFADIKGSWHIIEHMSNDDITLVLYFEVPTTDEVKDWKSIKLKVVGRYMSPDQRSRSLFGIEVMKIKGVVGVGGGSDSKNKSDFGISIADCMPNIRGIVKKAHAVAKKYGCTISEIRLLPNFEYLLKKEYDGE
jgi:hypothetical protein